MCTMVKKIKLVLFGNSGAGKTCIVQRMRYNTFNYDVNMTIGAAYTIDTVEDNLRIEMWDTAGQERFRALTKIYYQDADIAILVYDITNKESFDDIKNYWIDQLKLYAPKTISNNF